MSSVAVACGRFCYALVPAGRTSVFDVEPMQSLIYLLFKYLELCCLVWSASTSKFASSSVLPVVARLLQITCSLQKYSNVLWLSTYMNSTVSSQCQINTTAASPAADTQLRDLTTAQAWKRKRVSQRVGYRSHPAMVPGNMICWRFGSTL